MKRGLSTGDITSVGTDVDNGDGPFTQVRSRRSKKSKKADTQGQSGQCVVPVAVTDDNGRAVIPVETVSEISHLKKAIDELSTVVQNQQRTISNLTNKLKFVLSFLDITDAEPESADSRATVPSINTDMNNSDTDNDSISTNAIVSDITSQQPNQSAGQPVNYASVITSNRLAGGSGQPNNLHEAVVSAMYADQRARERRAKSVVVSGLAPSQDSNDVVTFQRLCMLEFGVDPAITYTRRLGRTDDNRIRPLLVGLQSADDVLNLLNHAKNLRRSANEVTRKNVFINKNMTKVEARLAYEDRCRRRHHRQQRNGTVGAASMQTTTATSVPVISAGRHRQGADHRHP